MFKRHLVEADMTIVDMTRIENLEITLKLTSEE
jgi:hypothetical protein